MKLHIITLSISLLFLTLFSNCTTDNSLNVIPNVSVDATLNINEPSSFNLQPIGGWVYYNGGSNGLIVYHVNQDEFRCFDRHSTYNVDNWCQVKVDSSGFTLVDTCSLSEFSIFDGSVTKGPATIPLKQYTTTYDGTFIYIRN